VLQIFIALKNPSPWPGFEPATFGSSGQHTNHYTTKGPKKSFLNYEKPLKFKLKKLANNLFEKLVMLLLVQYAITCHTINVTQ
jgi:hypothetical protein